MVDTKKFSEFADGGFLEPNEITVGFESSVNTKYLNAFPLLPPGSTGDRPAIAASMYYRLRFNTTLESYEYYSPVTAAWIQIEDSGDIADLIARLAAHTAGDGASMIGLENLSGVTNKTVQDMAESLFIAQNNTGTLTNAQYLDLLSTGFVTVTTGTGVLGSRVATGTVNQINIANGDGSGVPTWSVSSTFDMPGTFTIQGTVALDAIIDDDTMATATATNVPTSESVVAYIAATPGGAGGSNTQIQYNNAGTLAGDSGFTTDGAGTETIVGQLNVDNLRMDGNTLSSTDTNGNISILPDGTGFIQTASDIEVKDGIEIQFPSGEPVLILNKTTSGTPVAWFQITNSAGVSPSLLAAGTGANLDVVLLPKGDSEVRIGGGTASTFAGRVALREIPANGTNEVRLSAPDDITTLYTLTFPAAPPAANAQALLFTTAGIGSFGQVTTVTLPTVDQTIARFDGVAGALEDSGITIDDTDVMSGITQLNVDNLRLDGNTLSSTSGNIVLAATSNIDANTNQIKNVVDPTLAQDAATKNYVDTVAGGAGGSNTQIQYNNAGTLAGDSGFTTDGAGTVALVSAAAGSATSNLTIGNVASVPTVSAAGSDTNIAVDFQFKASGFYNFRGSSTSQSKVRLFEQTINGSDYVGFQPPASVTTAYTVTMPAAPPTVTESVLIGSTAATMNWQHWEKNVSWTPVLVGSSVAGTPTGTFSGVYSRFGDRVMGSCQIVLTALGGISGNISVQGLPYPVRSGAVNRSGISISFRSNWTNDFVIGGYTQEGTSNLLLFNIEVDNTRVTDADLSATTNLYFSFVYSTSS